MILLAVAVIVPLLLLAAALLGPGLVDRLERRRELAETERDGVVVRTAPYRTAFAPLEPRDELLQISATLTTAPVGSTLAAVAEAPVLEAPALVQKPRH